MCVRWGDGVRGRQQPHPPCKAEELPLPNTQIVSRLCHAGIQTACCCHHALELHSAQHAPQRSVRVLAPGIKVAAQRATEENGVLRVTDPTCSSTSRSVLSM
jgi:hypothetical protein